MNVNSTGYSKDLKANDINRILLISAFTFMKEEIIY